MRLGQSICGVVDSADCRRWIGRDCEIRLHILAGNDDYPIAILTGTPTRPQVSVRSLRRAGGAGQHVINVIECKSLRRQNLRIAVGRREGSSRPASLGTDFTDPIWLTCVL